MSTESEALLPTKKNEGSRYYKVGMWTGTTEQHLLYMWIGQFILGTCLFCAFAAAIIVAAVVYAQNKAQEPIQTFLTSQEFFANKTAYAHPFVDKSSEFAFPIYKIQCTNASGVPILFPLKNHKYAAIAKECDQPSNVCLRTTCSEDYLCVESLKDNATCSSDADCFTNSTVPGIPGYKYRCELSNCSCVAIHALPCTQDSDCPQNPLNTCAAYTCNVTDAANVCVLGLAGASTCSSDEECTIANGGDPFWKCNISTDGTPCNCYHQNECYNETTDCPILLNPCSFFDCDADGICNETLIPGAECSHSETCQSMFNSSFWRCDWGLCMCQFSPPINTTVQCTLDSECGTEINPCAHWVCNAGLCEEQLEPNATCFLDEQCAQTNGTGYICDWNTCGCSNALLPQMHKTYGGGAGTFSAGTFGYPLSFASSVDYGVTFVTLVGCPTSGIGTTCFHFSGNTSNDLYIFYYSFMWQQEPPDSGSVLANLARDVDDAFITGCTSQDYMSPEHFYGTTQNECIFSGAETGTGYVYPNLVTSVTMRRNANLPFSFSIQKIK